MATAFAVEVRLAADATSRCRRLEVFGEPFLAAISGRTGDLDEEKRRCLTDGLSSLPSADLDAVLATGVDPSRHEGDAVLDRLVGSCGVEVGQ